MSRRYGGYYDPWYKQGWGIGGIVILLVLIVAFVGGCSSYYADSSVTCNLRDKNIVPTGSGSSAGHDYRLNCDKGTEGTDGNETFVIEDSIIKGQLNTGDIYFRLHEGRKYTCDAYGWRLPLFSSFRAIHNCEDAGSAAPEAQR